MPSPRRLVTPDGQTLTCFFDDAVRTLGEDNVSRAHHHGALRGPQNQDSYGDPFSTSSTHQPSGAVRPRCVEEIQEIVKLANRYKVPLWTVSRGKNLGYVLAATLLLRLKCSSCSQQISGMADPALLSRVLWCLTSIG